MLGIGVYVGDKMAGIEGEREVLSESKRRPTYHNRSARRAA